MKHILKYCIIGLVVLTLCSFQTDGLFRRFRERRLLRMLSMIHVIRGGIGGFGVVPFLFTPALLPIFIATIPLPIIIRVRGRRRRARGRGITILLLLKLIKIKSRILRRQPKVSIGSLLLGTGAGLMAGKLGTIALLETLQPSKDDFNWCRSQYSHYANTGHGLGWNEESHVNYKAISKYNTYLVYKCWISKLKHRGVNAVHWLNDAKKVHKINTVYKLTNSLQHGIHSALWLKQGIHNAAGQGKYVEHYKPTYVIPKPYKQPHKHIILKPHHHHHSYQGYIPYYKSHAHAHGHGHGYKHAHGHAYGDSHAYGHGDAYSHAHGHGDGYSHAHTYGHGNSYAHTDGHGHSHAYVQAPSQYTTYEGSSSPSYTYTQPHDTHYGPSHHYTNYKGSEGSSDSSPPEEYSSSGQSYDNSDDPIEVASSDTRKVLVVQPPTPTPTPMKKTTNEEYFRGVMKFATEPISDLVSSLLPNIMSSKSNPMDTTMTEHDGDDDDADEYFKGIMKFAPETISDLMSTMFGLFDNIPTSNSSTNSTIKSNKPWEFPGLTSNESEVFLEQHFNQLKSTNPKDGMELIKILRSAYTQTLYDLGVNKSAPVPDFIPMPKEEQNLTILPFELDEYITQNNNQNETNKSANIEIDSLSEASNTITIEEHVIHEIKQFFTLLSTFDNETCFEKLVCDIHTRINEDKENFTPYESNVLAVFEMIKEVYSEIPSDVTTAKYLKAGLYGEKILSSELCQLKYPDCKYTTNQVMELGIDLEKKSEFSIPDYLMKNLDNNHLAMEK